MEPEGHVERLELAPEGSVVGLVPVARVHGIGAEKDPPESELLHAAAGVPPGILGAGRRDKPRAQQPRGVRGAERLKTNVISPRGCGGAPLLPPPPPSSE